MNFCSQLPELYDIMYVCSFRVLTYDCTLVHMITPFPNHEFGHLCLSLSCTLESIYSHFCPYVQMDNTESASANVETRTLVNYLEEGGFPALLWDTLKDFGYTTYPEYLTREVITTGQLLRCEVQVKIPVSV
jgi:hypothetical protein